MFASKNMLNILVVTSGLVLSACSGSTVNKAPPQTAAYALSNASLKICSGYGCIIDDRLVLSKADFQTVAAIMKKGSASPSAERAALGKAVAKLEVITRARLRTANDVGFSYQKHAGKRGQMDCIDESLNTISYLKFLYSNGLLKYHKPIRTFAERGLLIDGRYPHKSARMRENNGTDWAVDSWKGNGGSEPEIMLLSKWYKGRNDASQY